MSSRVQVRAVAQSEEDRYILQCIESQHNSINTLFLQNFVPKEQLAPEKLGFLRPVGGTYSLSSQLPGPLEQSNMHTYWNLSTL